MPSADENVEQLEPHTPLVRMIQPLEKQFGYFSYKVNYTIACFQVLTPQK